MSETPSPVLTNISRWRARLGPLGFGAAALGNLYSEVDESASRAAVETALAQGVRFFDTAPFYGHGLSERRLGDVLCNHHDIVVSTKVGRVIDAEPGVHPNDGFVIPPGTVARFDYSREGILRSVEASLERLSRDRVDILLLHDVGALTHGDRHQAMLAQALDEALPTLTQLKAEGMCDAIGIGVNEEAVCLDILRNADVDLIMLAGRYTLLEQTTLGGLMAQAERRSVGIVVGGPYNSGLLAPRDRPGQSYNYTAPACEVMARAVSIYALAEEYNVDVGAAALQFPLAHPAVVNVTAGMRSHFEVDQALQRATRVIPQGFWAAMRDRGLIAAEAPIP